MGKFQNDIGFIKKDGNNFVFCSRKTGKKYSVNQNQFAKNLFDSNNLCLVEIKNDSYAIIIESLGPTGILQIEEDAIAKKYHLPRHIPRKARDEVEHMDGRIHTNDISDRKDFRGLPCITIDPDDARDFDDSEYAVLNDDGTITGYSFIADGSHFVKPGTSLFFDVVEAGTSVYCGTKVFPMMPEKLSNDICSLNPDVDRLVISTSFTVDKDGKIISYTIEPAIIHSKHRLTYKEADYLHFGKNAPNDKSSHSGLIAKAFDAKPVLSAMWEMSNRLNKQNKSRGVFDIESGELKWIVSDDHSFVEGYEKEQMEQFTKVIENFAVYNGIIWGDFFTRSQTPCIYRNHLPFDDERKSNNLRTLLRKYHLNLPEDPKPVDYANIIDSVKGKRYEDIVVSAILRAQNSAEYSVENEGHLGLGIVANNIFPPNFDGETFVDDARNEYFKRNGNIFGFTVNCPEGLVPQAYCQCTSDMRRAGDLVNHVQMTSLLFNGRPQFDYSNVANYCFSCNKAEKMAESIEKEDNGLLASYWANANVGKAYLVTVINEDTDCYTVVAEDGLRMKLYKEMLSHDEVYAKNRRQRNKELYYYDRRLRVGDTLMVAIEGASSSYPYRIRCKEVDKVLGNDEDVSTQQICGDNFDYNDDFLHEI